MTLMNGKQSGDDHSDERYSQKKLSPLRTMFPKKRSPLRTITGPADPKEQRSWLELSPQITVTGPADPKEQRSWLELSPQITMTGPADPKEQPLTNCR
jgi:hypothetical protein